MVASEVPKVKTLEANELHFAVVATLAYQHHSSNEIFWFVALIKSVVVT